MATLPRTISAAADRPRDPTTTTAAPGERRHVDANQEFVALGVANVGAGLCHGFPVSSSGSRTTVARAAGGSSQLNSLIRLILVLATLLFLGPVLTNLPMAALGALVVYADTRLIDLADFRRLPALRRSELLLALGALAGVLIFDILYGVVLAVGLSVAEMLARVARPHDVIEGFVPGLAGMHDIDDYPARPYRSRAGRVPVRLAAVLRQRRRLPPPRAGRRAAGTTGTVVRAQHGSQRRGRHHRFGRGGRDPARL